MRKNSFDSFSKILVRKIGDMFCVEWLYELFGVDKSGISCHLKNIFNEGELDEEVVVAKIAIPTQHGAIPGKYKNRIRIFTTLMRLSL